MEFTKRYIKQNSVNIIAEIDNSVKGNLDALKVLLGAIGNDIESNELVRFQAMRKLHFARWQIIEGLELPDGSFSPAALVYVAVFDDGLEEHLKELLKVSRAGIHRIYSFCKGFPPESSRSDGQIIEFLTNRKARTPMAWSAIIGCSVQQIQAEQKLRNEIELFLDNELQEDNLGQMPPDEIRVRIRTMVGNREDLKWALEKIPGRPLPEKLWHWGELVGKVLFLLAISPIILLFMAPIWWLLLSRVFESRSDHNRSPQPPPVNSEELLGFENLPHSQKNALTIAGTIGRPYWYRRTTLKIIFWLLGTVAKYRATKGKLNQIETILFANWALWHNGKIMFFFSSYHGAWEIYMSQFSDRAWGPLNLLFGQLTGYLRTRFLAWDGARNESQYKRAVRNNQFPVPCFYAAYPSPSITNIMNNTMIRKGLSEPAQESSAKWLIRL